MLPGLEQSGVAAVGPPPIPPGELESEHRCSDYCIHPETLSAMLSALSSLPLTILWIEFVCVSVSP